MNNYPNSADTQPYRSTQAKLWQVIGLVLIGGGLLVMAWAGWMYYQQQAELSNPPAPIVDSAAIEILDTPTTSPEPTEPPAIAQSYAEETRPVEITPSPTPQPESIDVSPVVVEEDMALPTPTAEMRQRDSANRRYPGQHVKRRSSRATGSKYRGCPFFGRQPPIGSGRCGYNGSG